MDKTKVEKIEFHDDRIEVNGIRYIREQARESAPPPPPTKPQKWERVAKDEEYWFIGGQGKLQHEKDQNFKLDEELYAYGN